VTLTLTVTAEEEVELLMPEFGEALDRFLILDFVPRREPAEGGGVVASQKYRLQPPTSGSHSIPPILIEFVDRRPGQRPAPEGQDAYELLTPRLDFEVESVLPDSATQELKPPLGALQPLNRTAARRWLPWSLLGLMLAAAPLVVWYWRRSRHRARRRSAYEIARGRLDRLLRQPLPAGSQIDNFFVELSDIVRHYLEDRFELRAPELTTEEFLDAVSGSPDLSREHQELLQQFLRQADLVKFAGLQPGQSDIQRALQAAVRFLDETREDAPLITESAADQAASTVPVGDGRLER
jgi:hypothetical protein